MFSLFYCIWNNPDTKIHKLVLYLLKNMDTNSRTWSIYLTNVASMYGITLPIELIKQPPQPKETFKEYILTKITVFHESELRQRAQDNSKMKFLNVAASGLRGRHHPVLNGPTTTHQVRKLRPVLKLLTGDYYSYELRSKQTKVGLPHCRICVRLIPDGETLPVEDVVHIVSLCPATSAIRTRILTKIFEMIPLARTPVDSNKIISDPVILTQFLLDPNSLNLANDTRLHIDDPIVGDIFSLARDLCHGVHAERLRQLKEIKDAKSTSTSADTT